MYRRIKDGTQGDCVKFNLIDKIEHLCDDRVVGVKYVSLAEEYLADHFPTFPVLPGVLMLEAVTQAAGWLLHHRTGFSKSICVMREARNVKYGQFVAPGNFLRVEAELVKMTEGGATFKASGTVRGDGGAAARPFKFAWSWPASTSPTETRCWPTSTSASASTTAAAWDLIRAVRSHRGIGRTHGVIAMTEIYKKVQGVLVDALGVDEEEVTPKATLRDDLGAESIDFLDIVFRLEKAFTTDPAKPSRFRAANCFPKTSQP